MKRIIALVVTTLLFSVIGVTQEAAVIEASAAGDYVSGPAYAGHRWQGPTTCTEDRTPSNGLRPVVKNAVYDWNYNTNIAMWYKLGPGACDAFSQKIIVVQGNFGKTSWVGITQYSKRWGITTNGNWTYLFNSPITIKLNTYHKYSLSNWDHIITHELGHALGLGHVYSPCTTVMVPGWSCSPIYTQTTSNDRRWINYIYAQ